MITEHVKCTFRSERNIIYTLMTVLTEVIVHVIVWYICKVFNVFCRISVVTSPAGCLKKDLSLKHHTLSAPVLFTALTKLFTTNKQSWKFIFLHHQKSWHWGLVFFYLNTRAQCERQCGLQFDGFVQTFENQSADSWHWKKGWIKNEAGAELPHQALKVFLRKIKVEAGLARPPLVSSAPLPPVLNAAF